MSGRRPERTFHACFVWDVRMPKVNSKVSSNSLGGLAQVRRPKHCIQASGKLPMHDHTLHRSGCQYGQMLSDNGPAVVSVMYNSSSWL